jgi:leader peptidase (prepilin peptidase) / N-methyltransferase
VPPRLLLEIYAGLVGLIVGSFVNVLIYRLPRGRSFVLPRSRCPWCGAAVQVRDNIPVLSYLWLRGRCRHCTAPISPRYPLVELLVGGLFLACFERFGPTAHAIAAAVLCTFLVALAGIDLEHLLLPDALTFPGIAAGLLLQPWLPGTTTAAVVGVLAGAGALFLLAELWLWVRGEEGLGLGDAKLLAMVGAFLGWQGAATTLFFGILSGGLAGIVLLFTRRKGWKSRLPLGMFLGLGGLIALFAGNGLLESYLRLL